jgi:hypothetical protein
MLQLAASLLLLIVVVGGAILWEGSVDTAPFEEWSDEVGAFFTWGPGYTTGVYILTALGFLLFVAALIAWMVDENRKVTAQAARLRAAGLVTETHPGAPLSVATEPGAGPPTRPTPP